MTKFFAKLKELLKSTFLLSPDQESDDECCDEQMLEIPEVDSQKEARYTIKDLLGIDSLLDKINALKFDISRLKIEMPEVFETLNNEILNIESCYRDSSLKFNSTTPYELTTMYDPEKDRELCVKVKTLEGKVKKYINGDLNYILITKRIRAFITRLEEMYRICGEFSQRKLSAYVKDLVSQAMTVLDSVNNEDISAMYDYISVMQKEDLNLLVFTAKYLIEKTKIRYLKDSDMDSYFEGDKSNFWQPLVNDLASIVKRVNEIQCDDEFFVEKLKGDAEKLQQFNYMTDPMKVFEKKKFWADLFDIEDRLNNPPQTKPVPDKTVESINELAKTVQTNMTKKVIGYTVKERAIYFFGEQLQKVSDRKKEELFALSVILYYLIDEPFDANKLFQLILLFGVEDVVFAEYPQIDGYDEFLELFKGKVDFLKKYDPSTMSKKKEKIISGNKSNYKYYTINFGDLSQDSIEVFNNTLKLLNIDYFYNFGLGYINKVYFTNYKIKK